MSTVEFFLLDLVAEWCIGTNLSKDFLKFPLPFAIISATKSYSKKAADEI